MKIAILINPIKSVQVNIILDQTPFKNDINLISNNKRFIPTQEFYDFCVDLLGNQFGKIDNCYVVCLDIDNEDTLINPMRLILNNLIKKSKDEQDKVE